MANLGVLFTKNISLKIWVQTGLLERERQIYEKQIEYGVYKKIYWFTYGRNDYILGEELKKEGKLNINIIIVPMPKCFYTALGGILYSLLLPYMQKKVISQIDLIKTNQLDGGWTGVIIKKIYRIPFALRMGYSYTKLSEQYLKIDKGYSLFKRKINLVMYNIIEHKLFMNADVIIVTSKEVKKYIEKKNKIDAEKITVIPNFIDTSIFYYDETITRQERAIFVGRLDPIKNIPNMIDAVSDLGVGIDIFGDGILKEKLEQYVAEKKVDVNFYGRISNEKIAEKLQTYQYFLLTSVSEGMPKSLLEAMACGCICIATDVAGNNEIIRNGENGFLANGIDKESIRTAVNRAVHYSRKIEIQNRSVNTINKTYSLKGISELESMVENKILNDCK